VKKTKEEKIQILEDCKKLAEERDGECLSLEYVCSRTKMRWKHNVCGTIWEANFDNIKHNSWCPNRDCQNNKFKKTNLERLGVEFPTQNKEVKNKIKNTFIEKYGATCSLNNPEINIKSKKTMMAKYNCLFPSQNKEIREQIKKTNLERFGFDNPSKNKDIRNKIEQTNLERFGSFTPLKNKEVRDKGTLARKNKGQFWTNESLKQFFLSHPEYFIDDAVLPESCKSKAQFHDIEYGWFESLLGNVKNQFKLHSKRHKLIGGDIIPPSLLYSIPYYNAQIPNSNSKYRPDYLDEENKLIIEADGIFWHIEAREDNNFKVAHGVSKMQHFNKFEAYHNLGYKFLAFTDQEINDKPEIVKSLIAHKLGKTENKTSARKCKLVRLKANQAKEFFSSNHLMGSGSGHTYALEFNGEIVCALRFVNKETEVHISRFACKNQWNVVGGYSRLLKQLDKFNKTIVNFVDRRHGTGQHLANLGFVLESCRPGFWWTDGYNVYNRRKCLGNSGYAEGLEKYWDYGQAKWVKYVNKEQK
jgi:very-short-patch-repair endonuclease